MAWIDFSKEHRSNLLFFLLASGGGGTVIAAVGHAIANDIHGHPTDWYLFALFASVGLALSFFAWKLLKNTHNPESPKRESFSAEDRYYLENPEIIIDPLVAAERDRITSLGNRLDGIFTPLQVEAVVLARDLESFMNRIGDRPSAPAGSDWDGIFDHAVRGAGGQWVVRMQAEYEQDYSPRVNSYIAQLERETGRLNTRLRAYKDHVTDFGNINTVRAQLWKEALYPLTIDFSGE